MKGAWSQKPCLTWSQPRPGTCMTSELPTAALGSPGSTSQEGPTGPCLLLEVQCTTGKAAQMSDSCRMVRQTLQLPSNEDCE